jgi:hypothetical protein
MASFAVLDRNSKVTMPSVISAPNLAVLGTISDGQLQILNRWLIEYNKLK